MRLTAKLVPLSQICDVIDPHPSHRAPERTVEGIPFVGIGDFDSNGVLQIQKARIVSRSFLIEHKARYSLDQELLAVGRVASIGKVVRLPKTPDPFLISPTLAVVRPRDVDISYLFFALHSPQFQEQLSTLSRGSTRRSVGIVDLRTATIPLPSQTEQQRIVGILDEALDGIATAKANAEQNLQNARALFESHLQSVFTQRGDGWEKKPLTAVCEAIFAGGDVPKANSSKTKTDKYCIPIFTNGEKNKGLYGYTNAARVTEPSITISARGTIGYSEIRKESYYPAIRLIVVIPKNGILDLSFLYYAIESTDIGHSGTSIPQLTVPMVSGFTIPVPPIAVQQTIVEQIDALRKETQRLESLYQRKLAALDELKKSLLHQAFSGVL